MKTGGGRSPQRHQSVIIKDPLPGNLVHAYRPVHDFWNPSAQVIQRDGGTFISGPRLLVPCADIVHGFLVSPQAGDLHVAAIVLAGDLPAIDDDCLTRKKRRCIGKQEGNHPGNLFRLPIAIHRNLFRICGLEQ